MATVLAHRSTPLALLVSSDSALRNRLCESLTGLRWRVLEASGGAEALGLLDAHVPQAVVLDAWLPDLNVTELTEEIGTTHPEAELLATDGTVLGGARIARRGELLHALRSCESANAGGPAPLPVAICAPTGVHPAAEGHSSCDDPATSGSRVQAETTAPAPPQVEEYRPTVSTVPVRLPEFIGNNPRMLEVSRRIRLVAPRRTSVLVQGPTGTGKELVARGLHRLSPRASKPFVALNCAAIPEALLEAELFGHSRGAFTGAVQRRVGRIEAAHGGTLFLDEIGEMPLALQSKLLRFLETGELQRVGENETVQVDVRVVAATHQPLASRAKEGNFRADLFYRLAVFLIATPALAEHREDVPLLAEHFLSQITQRDPVKQLSPDAMFALTGHDWPGNVRELAHVIERAYILAEDRPAITAREIEFDEAL